MEGAARLHEFIIKVYHPDPEHASKISLHLHVKWATLFLKKTERSIRVRILDFRKHIQILLVPSSPSKNLS